MSHYNHLCPTSPPLSHDCRGVNCSLHDLNGLLQRVNSLRPAICSILHSAATVYVPLSDPKKSPASPKARPPSTEVGPINITSPTLSLDYPGTTWLQQHCKQILCCPSVCLKHPVQMYQTSKYATKEIQHCIS